MVLSSEGQDKKGNTSSPAVPMESVSNYNKDDGKLRSMASNNHNNILNPGGSFPSNNNAIFIKEDTANTNAKGEKYVVTGEETSMTGFMFDTVSEMTVPTVDQVLL